MRRLAFRCLANYVPTYVQDGPKVGIQYFFFLLVLWVMAGDLSIEQRKWIFKQYRKTENAERVEAFNTIYYVLYTYFWPTLYIGKITNRVKETQLDAKLILSIFRQTVHVSGVSRPIIRRYNLCMQQLLFIILKRG